MSKFLLISIFSSFFITSCNNSNENLHQHAYDPCINGKDTTIGINFTLDTTSSDFFGLLELFKQQTEFKNINSNTFYQDTGIYLKKVICFKKDYESPIETTILKNVYSLNCSLVSVKSVNGYKKYFPLLDFQQLNFITENEKDSALRLIKKIGLGDPNMKWNDYTYIASKNRIYILSNRDATFQDYDEKYIRFIKNNWIEKTATKTKVN